MNKLVTVLIALSFCLVGCTAASTDDDAMEFNGTEYRNPAGMADFTLPDQNGVDVTLSDLEGKVVVVAFTYTHCPDVCLAVSHSMNYVHSKLGDTGIAEDVVFLSITIDPARDTQERLSNWTESNGFDWSHLTSTDHDKMQAIWADWNVVVDNDHLYSDHSSHHGDNESHSDHDNMSHSDNESADDSHDDHSDHSDHDSHDSHESHDSGQADTADVDEEYLVGHSTVTFILDQDGMKKVAWVGSDWNGDLFLEDLVTLVHGSSHSDDDHAGHDHHNH